MIILACGFASYCMLYCIYLLIYLQPVYLYIKGSHSVTQEPAKLFSVNEDLLFRFYYFTFFIPLHPLPLSLFFLPQKSFPLCALHILYFLIVLLLCVFSRIFSLGILILPSSSSSLAPARKLDQSNISVLLFSAIPIILYSDR